jgi:cytochrome c oxidase subunit IV
MGVPAPSQSLTPRAVDVSVAQVNSPTREPKSARPTGKRLVKEVAQVLCGGWKRLWPRLWIILAAAGVGMLLVLIASDADNSLLNRLRFADGDGTPNRVAAFISDHADLMLAVPLSVLIWGAGAASGLVRWRKVGLACLMAALMAGLLVNVFRATTGRPRPKAEVTDGFYGPHPRDSKYQSFPSGHATTATATAAVIAAAVPVTTIPCVIYAVVVSWSRIQLRMHHPIDVTVGAIIGAVCGLCFASTVPRAVIRLRRRRSVANGLGQVGHWRVADVFAVLCFVVGLIGLIYFLFFFDTSVPDGDARVVNLGLMQNREFGVIGSIAMIFSGLLLKILVSINRNKR